jgi:hypothetical protein
MNPKKLKKLRRDIDNFLRRGGINSRELEALARALGRKRHPRGSDPAWVSELAGSHPISIPNHPTDLNRFTARNILDQLEADIDRLEANDDEEDG